MPEFLSLTPLDKAIETLLQSLPESPSAGVEEMDTSRALNRILAISITAPIDLPPFSRSTVDGYALQAKDTFGASGSLPAYLQVVGEILMGESVDTVVESGQAMIVHTGGMIPTGADAVVMLEDTQIPRSGEVEVLRPVAVGENVLQTGEDVQTGDAVLSQGTLLRPQEIGGLMAFGITRVPVLLQPKIGILSTGDEVIPPESQPGPAQVRDINSYTLSSLVESIGGQAVRYGIIPDDFDTLFRTLQQAHNENDGVLITAGSSVSARDISVDAIEKLGKPGVLVHGIAIRPGKPTILAVADGKPVIGLPGNPVSALVIGMQTLPELFAHLLGMKSAPQPQIAAVLSTNVASVAGREDFVPVRLIWDKAADQWMAEPVLGRSNLIFTLVRADGHIRIPTDATGAEANSIVTVYLFPK